METHHLKSVFDIEWKLLTETAKLPAAGRPGDIGFDVCSDQEITLEPGNTYKISTGVQLANMLTEGRDGHSRFIKVEGRSGLASKGIFPVGGIVDPTYRGEVFIALTNNSPESYKVSKGDKIAQFVIYKVLDSREVKMVEGHKVTETVRGENGFGSSGQ